MSVRLALLVGLVLESLLFAWTHDVLMLCLTLAGAVLLGLTVIVEVDSERVKARRGR